MSTVMKCMQCGQCAVTDTHIFSLKETSMSTSTPTSGAKRSLCVCSVCKVKIERILCILEYKLDEHYTQKKSLDLEQEQEHDHSSGAQPDKKKPSLSPVFEFTKNKNYENMKYDLYGLLMLCEQKNIDNVNIDILVIILLYWMSSEVAKQCKFKMSLYMGGISVYHAEYVWSDMMDKIAFKLTGK